MSARRLRPLIFYLSHISSRILPHAFCEDEELGVGDVELGVCEDQELDIPK